MSRRSRPHYRPGLGWILGIAFEDTLPDPVPASGQRPGIVTHEINLIGEWNVGGEF